MCDLVNNLPESYKNDILKALKIFKEYGVTDVYLFGSLAKGTYNETSDIDFAVKGLKPELYFKVGGDLMMSLNKKCDLIDLDSKTSNFANMLLKRGGLIKID